MTASDNRAYKMLSMTGPYAKKSVIDEITNWSFSREEAEAEWDEAVKAGLIMPVGSLWTAAGKLGQDGRNTSKLEDQARPTSDL